MDGSTNLLRSEHASLPVEICDNVVGAMDMSTLLNWRSTARDACVLATGNLERTRTYLLERFVVDAHSFVNMMRTHRCVISGSSALWFFDRAAEWEPQDLDIYTPHSEWEAVLSYLETVEGATVDRTLRPVEVLDDGYVANHGIAAVARAITHKGSIDVVQSQKETPLWPIAFFWTDLLKNILGADQAMCAAWTLLASRRGMVVPRTLTEKESLAAAKYVTRGYAFDLTANAWVESDHNPCLRWLCPHRVRTFGDNACLMISYDVMHPDSGTDVVQAVSLDEAVGWKLAGPKCSEDCPGWPTHGPLILSGTRSEIEGWAARTNARLDGTD